MPSPIDKLATKVTPLGNDAAAADRATAAANTTVVITYAAVSTKRHVIGGVAWSYSAAPTGGKVTVEDEAGTVIFEIDITAAGPGEVPFRVPKRGRENKDLIITLAAGGVGIVGKLNILGHWHE